MPVKGFFSRLVARLFPLTLKARMATVVILLVLGATTIVTTVALLLAERDMKSVIGSQQYAVLSTAAAYVDEQLENKRALLATLPEGLPPGAHADPGAMQRLLESRPIARGEFFNIIVFDRSGQLVATLRPDFNETRVSASAQPYFENTVQSRKGLVSEPFLSRLSGRPVVVLTQPVLDKAGDVAFVIVGSIDLQKSDFFGPINALKPGKTGFMFIMTADGVLIHHPTQSRLLQHINARPGYNRATEMALAGFEGWTEAKNKDGAEGIYAYKRLRTTGWIVGARYPTAEAFEPLIELRRRAILAASAFAAVAGVLSWFAISRLLAPLQRLRTGLAKIRDDDADIALLRMKRKDEIGELAEAIYSLTAERSEALAHARDNESLVRNILQHAPDAFIGSDQQGRIVEWNAQAERTFGWSREEAMGRGIAELMVPPAMRKAHNAGMERFARTGGGPLINSRVRVHALHRDGREIPVELSIGALRHGDEHMATAFLHDVSERVAYEEKIAAGERRARMIADSMPALVAYIDRDLRYRFTNDHYQYLLGLDPRSMLGKTVPEVFGPDLYQLWEDQISKTLRGERVHIERRSTELGMAMHMMVDLVPDIGEDGVVAGFYLMAMDITQRKEAELTQAASEKRLRLITDNLPVLISYLDHERKLRFGNATYQRWMHIDPTAVLGHTLVDIIGTHQYAKCAPYLDRAYRGEVVSFELRTLLHGEVRTLDTTFVPDMQPDGTVAGVYALSHDMTRVKAVEEQLIELARMDTLTGIANRRKFDEVLWQAMERCRRQRSTMALAYLDIDNFKTINDTLGHGAGDEVLKAFAARLLGTVRGIDTVARLAGDEFVIVFENISHPAEAAALAAKVVGAVREALELPGGLMQITTSLGIACYSGGKESQQELIARADRALYAAKRKGRNCYEMETQCV
ncbi:PAS domain S-box protein [Duganella sp. FT92W]|uniref:PAS domain S-box protein n=2 Tax=Pseudoduganella rivuli TaxID=2666085 RepID=A0A7X2IP45_9BURK|nr:PAS domain S-box protein [Pseudoduganella rivuli]